MKTLCIFANEFPYGSWEAYLETEVKFYSEFDKVYIFSLQLRKEHAKTKRSLPENFEVIPIWYAPKWKYLLNCVRVLGDVNLYKELFLLGKKGQLKIGRIIDLFIYLSRSNYEMRKIKKSVELQKLKNAIFYSYRFEYQPYVAMLLRKELKTDNKIISRAHRYDLYEEFRKNKYIPCRELLIKNLDAVYPCSEDGTCYLQSRFPKYKNKIKTRFIKVHRALKNEGVKCVHYILGDGPSYADLKQKITENDLEDRIILKGYIENPYPWIKEADMLACVSYAEGYSSVVCEAVILGVPVITTECSGMKDILGDSEYGLIVKNDDISIINGIKKMVTNKEFYQKYLLKVKERRTEFSVDNAVKQLKTKLEI